MSAFSCTNLELVLRGLDAEFTGVSTNQCVAATTKDAMFRDFIPIVVKGCTGTIMPHLHGSAIEMMSAGWAEVRGLDDTIASIDKLS